MNRQEIAERGLALETVVGSTVHGTAIEGQDDRDLMGICIEDPRYVIGLGRFEQYEFRSAAERDGANARSQAGDTDRVVYSLRKWLRLALKGNPSILLPMFAPDDFVLAANAWGHDIRAKCPELVASRQAGRRFLGFMLAQRDRMLGKRGGAHGKRGGGQRPELIEMYGYDTKFAMHMVRLGIQGVEYLQTGRITLPIPEPHLTRLRDLRGGKLHQIEAVAWSLDIEADLKGLLMSSPLPPDPDWNRANDWLVKAYGSWWEVGL